MNHDSGFGTNGIPYEYAVAERKSTTLILKKVTLVILYVMWAVGWLMFGMMKNMIAPFLALIPLSLWVIVFLTWRYTQVEYEYSYFTGVLTVCKILGGRSRRTLATITIRNLSAVYPCNEEYAARVEAFGEEKTVFAASATDAEGLYAALWVDEDGTKKALYFEPNEKALKILKYYNAAAMSKATSTSPSR